MEPVVTPTEMGEIDRAASEPVEVLIDRAGWATARAALGLLGRRYGVRVLVLAGKGNNGADGRSAARYLEQLGVRCCVVAPDGSGAPGTDRFDLVIDAAYGTGFRGTYQPPDIGDVPVLAVDIPSGVDGLTGQVGGAALRASATVTFAALKPGLLLEPGRSLAGPVTVAGIGLDCSCARAWHLGPGDLVDHWPRVGATAHKWQRAVWVIGGGPGMTGAPALAAAGAARAGAGYVAVSVPPPPPSFPVPFPLSALERQPPAVSERQPSSDPSDPDAPLAGPGVPVGPSAQLPIESVVWPMGEMWGADVVDGQERFRAVVVGPGLPVDGWTGTEVRSVVVATTDRGLVLDGGAIDAVVVNPEVLARRRVPAVLTPHDGELTRLLGHPPGPNRLAAAREAAARLGAVVLSKGPTTVAADPSGKVLISTVGDQRLASAGTGDVLAGLVGAALAGGLPPLEAAGLAAELHGRAALTGRSIGFVASDLPPLVADYLTSLQRRRRSSEAE